MSLRTTCRAYARATGLCLILLSLSAGESFAWREAGHFSVCEIAYRNLTAEAREQVDAILDGSDFATQCTWADMVRRSERWKHTYPWHYVNLEDGEKYFAAGNVEPKGDVLQALLLAEAKLQGATTAKDEKRTYLRFLGHFAGDVHQPLHAGRKGDLGGNRITVSWFGEEKFEAISILKAPDDAGDCTGENRYLHAATGECVQRKVRQRSVNLHKAWDLLIIRRFIEQQELLAEPGDSTYRHKAYATAVEGLLDDDEIERANLGTFWDWIAESLRDRHRAYAVGDGKLGHDYYQRNIDYVNRQIALAGHRLAFTLNRIFAASPTPEAKAIESEHRKLRARILKLAGETSPLAGL